LILHVNAQKYQKKNDKKLFSIFWQNFFFVLTVVSAMLTFFRNYISIGKPMKTLTTFQASSRFCINLKAIERHFYLADNVNFDGLESIRA
jgi:hypothetical protein